MNIIIPAHLLRAVSLACHAAKAYPPGYIGQTGDNDLRVTIPDEATALAWSRALYDAIHFAGVGGISDLAMMAMALEHQGWPDPIEAAQRRAAAIMAPGFDGNGSPV